MHEKYEQVPVWHSIVLTCHEYWLSRGAGLPGVGCVSVIECIIAHYKAARLDTGLTAELVYLLFPFLYNISKYFIARLL